jgi:hypothetical protein
MDTMTDPRSDPTHSEDLEGDEELSPPLAGDVAGPASVVGPDGDPRPAAEAEDPEGADD